MNERIQELIKQATSIQGPTHYNPLTFEVFDKEKFAELLIKKCMAIAIGNGSNFTAKDIAEHFGVQDSTEDDWMQQAQRRAEDGEW